MSWKGYVSHLVCLTCGKKVFSDRELELHKKNAHNDSTDRIR